jgi:excisionase family DNA binding protein
VPSHSEAQSGIELRDEEILTLSEAAAYLRVPEKGLADLATAGNVPAREIGGEWRFSRRALADWLRFPSLQPGDDWRIHPRWLYESPFLDEFILLLEKRLLMHLQQQPQEPSPRPGQGGGAEAFRDLPHRQPIGGPAMCLRLTDCEDAR